MESDQSSSPKFRTRKVLVIRYSSIGDIVLTTPLLRCIARQWDAEIHFLTKGAFLPLVQNNPHVFRVHEKEKITVNGLKSIGFEHVFDLQKNMASSRLTRLLGLPVTSFNKLNIPKWLLVNTKLNFLPNKHLVDRYFDAVRPLGIEDDGLGCDYFIRADKVADEFYGLAKASYDILVLGAAHATKRISLKKAKEIASLRKRTLIIIGGKDTIEMAAMLKKDYPEIVNVTGKTNFDESAFLLQHAQIIYTGDTGMMHVAAALQKKIVVLWGNTVPAFGMYPYYGKKNPVQSIYFENEAAGCRPCSKLGFATCPKGHFDCMEKLYINPVAVEALEKDELPSL